MARRAQHDTQYWAEHIAGQQASGLSIREYCERESLPVHHFYYYRKRVTSDEFTKLDRRQVTAEQARPAPTTNQPPVTKSTTDKHSPPDHSQAVVIRLGDYAVVQVPATMLATIEAVLKMAISVGQPRSQPSASAFRSVIVRS